MKFGQMSFPKVSGESNYVQLDICGLKTEETLLRAEKYKGRPIVLHGDWTKNGFSENEIARSERQQEYLDIMLALKKEYDILGFTIHPPFRSKMAFDDFVHVVQSLEKKSGIPFFIENRSNQRIWLSKPQEIIDFSHIHSMTIDIPQLYISCGYNEALFIETCHQINWGNVKEVHLANLVKREKNTFVARKVDDGCIPIKDVLPLFKSNTLITLEILGGAPTFDNEKNKVLTMI